MTLAEFQANLHRLYQGDTDAPTSGDEDYTVRTSLLENAVNLWASEKGVLWRELWTTATGTTSAGTTISLAAITDWRFPGGFLRIKEDGVNWAYWPLVDLSKSELIKNGTASPKTAWITGNKKTGFTINLSSSVAASLDYEMPYYKDPFVPSSSSHVIEMSDPWFAVYISLSKLHETDGEGDRATLALSMANEKLSAMKVQNARMPAYQDNYVPDQAFETGTAGFGD